MEKRAYEYVIEYIKDEIKNKNLQSGNKIPSERDLSKKLKISRTSVREGLRELERLKLTHTIKGRGSFIQDEKIKQVISKSTQKINEKEQKFLYDMLDYRRAIEVESARLAAQRATTDNLLEMKKALELMIINKDEKDIGIKADLMFHTSIIKASQNKIFIELIEVLYAYMKDTIKQTRKHRLININATNKTIEEHKEIYSAIAKGNSNLAAKLVENHIIQIKEELIEFELNQIK